MTTRTISNTDDVIDSRDVIARVEELESERETLMDAITEAQESLDSAIEDKEEDSVAAYTEDRETAKTALTNWDEGDEGQELKILKSLVDEAEGYSDDWKYGATLIRDSYFEDYARELADDIGAVDKDAKWPNTCIDWDKAASELQQDYTSVEFDGVTYWVR